MDYIKTVSGPIVSMADADMMPLTQCLVDINAVQSGTGTPSPTNVRPISGFDTATIYVRGKNILNPTFTTKTENGVTFENVNKTVKITGTASAYSFCNLNYTNGVLAIPKGRPLKLAGGFSNSIYLTACYFKEGTSTTITAATSKSGEFVPFTIPEDASTSWIRVNVAAGATTDMTILPMVCADGTTDTAFKPYDARSFTKSVSLGRTVYDGTLDVVSGVLTVDSVMVDLGTLYWAKTATASDSYRFYTSEFSSVIKKPIGTGDIGEVICSTYGAVSFNNANSNHDGVYVHPNGTVGIYDSAKASMTAAEFKTAMNGVQLVYELAEPQAYTLTGQEVIPIIGEDTIWGNGGDVDVSYHYLPYGLHGDVRINGDFFPKPVNFAPAREDVYAGEYTTCTGRLLADKIGWKHSDITLEWAALPQTDLRKLAAINGEATFVFDDVEGRWTEKVIRKKAVSMMNRNTINGKVYWKNVSIELEFINAHNDE